nr:unnamed protein product [Callosobruchus analis]
MSEPKKRKTEYSHNPSKLIQWYEECTTDEELPGETDSEKENALSKSAIFLIQNKIWTIYTRSSSHQKILFPHLDTQGDHPQERAGISAELLPSERSERQEARSSIIDIQMSSESENTSTASAKAAISGAHDENVLKIFQSAESSLHFKIPEYIKNLLFLAGFESLALIATMTEKNIEELELYAKEELKSIVPQKDYVKYYGSTYKNYPEKFKFVIGHKKMLHLLIEFCKSQENSANEENKENIRDTVVKLDNARSISNSENEVIHPIALTSENYMSNTSLGTNNKNSVYTQNYETRDANTVESEVKYFEEEHTSIVELSSAESKAESQPNLQKVHIGTSLEVDNETNSKRTKLSKWSTVKYSRTERLRRAREKGHQGQLY